MQVSAAPICPAHFPGYVSLAPDDDTTKANRPQGWDAKPRAPWGSRATERRRSSLGRHPRGNRDTCPASEFGRWLRKAVFLPIRTAPGDRARGRLPLRRGARVFDLSIHEHPATRSTPRTASPADSRIVSCSRDLRRTLDRAAARVESRPCRPDGGDQSGRHAEGRRDGGACADGDPLERQPSRSLL